MPDYNGYKLKYGSDRFYHEVWVNGEYAPALLHRSDIVFDVGACAGEFSFWMAEKAKHVYAFEPHKESFDELAANIVEFGFDNVTAYNLALGDFTGEGNLILQVRGGHALLPYHPAHENQDVAVTTVNQFMETHGITHVDIMKIDIEDGERAVFNAPDWPEAAAKVDYIIGEHLNDSEERLAATGYEGSVFEKGKFFWRG